MEFHKDGENISLQVWIQLEQGNLFYFHANTANLIIFNT